MAYLITNPRRHNGAKDFIVAKALGITRAKAKELKASDYKKYQAAFEAAGGESARASRVASGSERRAASKKMFAAAAGKKKKKGSGRKTAAAAKPAAGALPAGYSRGKDGKLRRGGRLVKKADAEAIGLAFKANRGRRRNAGAGILADVRGLLMDDFTVKNIGAAASVGVIHYYAAPLVNENIARLGVGGEWVSENIPYSATGALGGALILAGGIALGQRDLANYIAGAAFFTGVAFDALNYLTRSQGGFGDIAVVQNPNHYGDIAVTSLPPEDGVVGYGALGMVPAPDYGSLVYGDASMADAAVCAADFSSAEGQALIDGPRAMSSRFPVTRSGGMRRGTGSPYSRHAGQQMHQFGWLFKLVGTEKARAIAALPPQERLKVIEALKRQALMAVNRAIEANTRMGGRSMNEATSASSDYAAVGAEGAFGAQGASGAYGATISMGAGF